MKKIVLIFVFIYYLVSYSIASSSIFGWGKPIWFNDYDALYILEWNSDMFFVDENWRQSWYKNWHSIDEIPWVSNLITFWWNDSNRKEIYMSERKDLRLIIVWKSKESYTLTIAWWNYHFKLENVETIEWQIDEIFSKEDYLFLDFDDNKNWNYNLSLSHRNYKNWNAYFGDVKITWEYQKYAINWVWVDKNISNSIVFSTEKDTDWNENKYNIIFDDDKFLISKSKSIKSINYLLICIIILSLITFLLLIYSLYKKKLSKKCFFILFSIFILALLYSFYNYNNNHKMIFCTTIKEPWKDYDWKWWYEIKYGTVYIKNNIWSTLNYDLEKTEIDWKTFKIIWSWYLRDKNGIYYYWNKLDFVDSCSFEVSPFFDSRWYSQWFARDKNYVFYLWRVLKKADVRTFTKIWPFYKDKNYVYNSYGETLDALDVNTFAYNSEKYFSYDKNWVYVSEDIMIKWADWKTFKKIGGWYLYKDKNNVYYKTEIINWADSETFEEISYEYYKDKNYIYKSNWQIIEWADSETFSKFGKFYYDKNWVYPEKWFFISWAEIKSFKSLEDWYYIDNKNAYYINKYFKGWDYAYTLNVIKDVNIESFLKLSNWYAKDDINVYYLWLIVEWVDVESFSIIWLSYTKDKNNVYYKWKIIENADPNTFKYFWWKLSVDKNNAYSQWEIIEGIDPNICIDWSECNTNYSKMKKLFN